MSEPAFDIIPYTSAYAEEWNAFVASSRQGTFLFNRGYMDYHSDRFQDASLLIRRHGKGRLYALLPAHRKGETICSHGGLTYGGLLTGSEAKAAYICKLFEELNAYWRAQGICKVVYKAMPWIYHRQPAQEDLYALTQICHASLTVREISSTILIDSKLKVGDSAKNGLRKARKRNLRCRMVDYRPEMVKQCDDPDWKAFWKILTDNLVMVHHTCPVHTLEEMMLLVGRFPEAIRLAVVYEPETQQPDGTCSDDVILGGTVLYLTGQVVHTQYIAASPEGKSCGALDMLFHWLLNDCFPERQQRCVKEDPILYFDFGKSTEDAGHYLNSSLIFQKEGFGGRGVCYDTYEWEL